MSHLGVHECIIRWVSSFVSNRSQYVKIRDSRSHVISPKGGIPQGTRLAPLLFAILVNRLARDWQYRIKYVDDATVFEVVPRNSPSYLPFVANDINSYALARNMRLNAKKCKEMAMCFLTYNSTELAPMLINGCVIERVDCYKLLGVHITSDFSWNTHCDAIVKKATKRLYAIRALKKSGLSSNDLIQVYCSTMRAPGTTDETEHFRRKLYQQEEEEGARTVDSEIEVTSFKLDRCEPEHLVSILVCSICMGVPSTPVVTQCDQIFCSGCITAWLRNAGACSSCRSVLEVSDIDPLKGPLLNIYSLVKIKCAFSCIGCLEVLAIKNLKDYESLCPARHGKLPRKKETRTSNPFKEPLISVTAKYARQKRLQGIIGMLNSFCKEQFEDKGDVLFFLLCQHLRDTQDERASSIDGL
ncbi:V(D)J recombination-activating protein 1-like [Nematostella vectensis]|uniref:V(D)J recombination-activating protein 1-like n=1 Tax=Nematostella vectensis TaxID=45351 RepID=UPI0020770C90|nr:V(D)J recombination-activating protein 1-like [Nematostella vectensis]